MSDRSLSQEMKAHEGPHITCPHCGFENPEPNRDLLEGATGFLCRRCQRTILFDPDDSPRDT